MEKFSGVPQPRIDWKPYIETTEGNKPRRTLVEALNFVHARDAAADLGAGALNDTHYLLEQNFARVVAVDSEPFVQEKSARINDLRLEVRIGDMQYVLLEPDTFDIISAQSSLFFVPTEHLQPLVDKIFLALKEGGIFAAQFLGSRDSWHGMPGRYTQSKQEIVDLLQEFSIKSMSEIDEDRGTAINPDSTKHWHLFNVIAQKHGN